MGQNLLELGAAGIRSISSVCSFLLPSVSSSPFLKASLGALPHLEVPSPDPKNLLLLPICGRCPRSGSRCKHRSGTGLFKAGFKQETAESFTNRRSGQLSAWFEKTVRMGFSSSCPFF